MAIETNLESVLGALRSDLLTKLGNSAQGTQQTQTRNAVGHIADQSANARDINTASQPLDPNRGRNLDIKV